MKFSFKVENWLDVFKHIGVLAAASTILVLFFFYVYLPISTNHGETITVPDLVGTGMEELDEQLIKRDLRFEVSDSAYSSDYPPLTVLRQFPKPGSKVKENRKVFISVNSFTPPSTQMPNLVDKSLKNAELILSSFELKVGKIKFRPNPYLNAVLEQQFNGEIIDENTNIPKGSVIDLVVGDGYGNRIFNVPDLIGRSLEDVTALIAGISLRLGSIINSGDSMMAPGFITRQIPESGEKIRIGESIDIWVDMIDSLVVEDNIINENQ